MSLSLHQFVLLVVVCLVWSQLPLSYEDDSDFNKKPETDIIQDPLLSPTQQIESGVAPEDVECQDEYTLLIRDSDENPVACVRPESVEKFEQLGLGRGALDCESGTLVLSTTEGIEQLTVGFFLNGTDNRCMKSWDFGDKKIKLGTYGIIESHKYDYNFNNATFGSYSFNGHVNITDPWFDPNRTKPSIKPFSVTILRNNNTYITNVNQLQGVILQNDYAGFSIAIGEGMSKIKWTFGESAVPTQSKFQKTAHHQYNNLGVIRGNVTVTPITDRPYSSSEYWDFAVLVVPRMTTEWTVKVAEHPHQPYDEMNILHADKKINFYCEYAVDMHGSYAAGRGSSGSVYICKWDFGDNSTLKTDKKFISHTYKDTGNTENYLITCDSVHKETNGKNTASKTIIVVPPETSDES